MRILNTILNLVFPRKCLSCKREAEDLCPLCLASSPTTERTCAEWIFPMYDYRHPPLKKAVHFLKYKGRKNLAKIFAKDLYEKLLEEISETKNFKNPVLIPIPLSKRRLRERGYNQTEILAEELSVLSSGFLKTEKTSLVKPRETEPQAGIKNRSRRVKNMKKVFTIENRGKIRGRNIILIDDVITTGATLKEARETLQKAGCGKVIAFTLAH